LRTENAQWPTILTALNPRGDRAIAKLLVELRGPHLFAPQVALNVIMAGAQRALAANPGATALDALRESLRSTDTVVKGTGG